MTLKEWNNKRAEAEKKGLEKFYKMLSSPILHPSKYEKSPQITEGGETSRKTLQNKCK